MKQLILLATILKVVFLYPSGPPSSACKTRTPLHGAEPQASSTCPFTMVGLPWIPGEYVKAGIIPQAEGSSTTFKGFLASVYHNGIAIGQMKRTDDFNSPANSETKLVCDGTSIGHANDTQKYEVYFEWMAPKDLDPNSVLELRLTVVQELETFWVDCNSAQYLSKASEESPTSSESPTTQPQTTPQAATTTTPSPAPQTTTTTRAPVPTPSTTRPPAPTPPTTRPTTPTPTTTRPPAPTPTTTKTPLLVTTTAKPVIIQSNQPTVPLIKPSQPTLVSGKPVDSVEDYIHKSSKDHVTVSHSTCTAHGNTFVIIPGSNCIEFEQSWAGSKLRHRTKCPPGTKFDPRVCVCAFTEYCPDSSKRE